MAGVPEPRPQSGNDVKPAIVGLRMKHFETGFYVFAGIDRCHRAAIALCGAAVELFNFYFLNIGAVRQHHPGQIDCGRRGMDCT